MVRFTTQEKQMKTRTVTRTLILAALMLNLGVASVHAQQYAVGLVFSGNGAHSPINLTAARYKYRRFFPSVAGAGIFRFQNGSLLTVNLTHGGDCIDLVAQEVHCTLTLQITGGSGRFKDASGVLTFTTTALPVLADAAN
jgi:hypothetical protein